MVPHASAVSPSWAKAGSLETEFVKEVGQPLDHPIAYGVAAYTLVELVTEIFHHLYPIAAPQTSIGQGDVYAVAVVIEETAYYLDDFLKGRFWEVTHDPEKHLPTDVRLAVNSRLGGLEHVFDQLNMEPESLLIQSVRHAWDFVTENHFYLISLRNSLWRLYTAVDDLYGEEAALEVWSVWWNRVFSRLAFVQEEVE